MIEKYVDEKARQSRRASTALRLCSAEQRNKALMAIAEILEARVDVILFENKKDLQAATEANLSSAMVDRLTLNKDRIAGIAQAVREIANFADPLNKTLSSYETKEGLQIEKKTVPIGSILFIYESRPNVTIDGAALCLKSGNAVILRGGKESLYSSKILVDLVRECLSKNGIARDAVQLIDNPDRAIVNELLTRNSEIDLVIPRGGESLIQFVAKTSTIPVIKHYKGVCHVYLDKSADVQNAVQIALNAKVQRPGVCNAMETLLLHKEFPGISDVIGALLDKGVQLFGNAEAATILGNSLTVVEDPYDTEYLDYKLSVKFVDSDQMAIEHIQKHSSGHTEAVVAENKEVQDRFLAAVDSSSVMVNASTRFADGGMYGLGAEVGISTDKLHARGPMGVESLTSYKWVVRGAGHVRA